MFHELFTHFFGQFFNADSLAAAQYRYIIYPRISKMTHLQQPIAGVDASGRITHGRIEVPDHLHF